MRPPEYVPEDIQLGSLENAIIELFDPVYETTTNTLTYTIMAENGTSSEFRQTTLVIDSS